MNSRDFLIPPEHLKSKLLVFWGDNKNTPLGVFFDLFCDSVGIRTQDPQLRRLLLYPTELPNLSLKWVQR